MPDRIWAFRALRRSLSVAVAAIIFTASTDPAQALDVSVVGVDEALREQAEGGSLLFQQTTSEEPIQVRELVGIAQADYQRVLAILYEAGYFGAVISIKLDGQEAAEMSAVAPPNEIAQAVITVDPGRQFKFGKAEIDPLAPGSELPEGFRTGQPAGLSTITASASAAVSGWRDEGHAKAALSGQKITARHRDAEIDASLQVDPGPKLRFGKVTVEGQSAVRSERILEIAALPQGEVFSPEEQREATLRLQRTGAFRSVALLEDETPSDDGTLDFTARVTDSEPRRIGFGGDVSTIEGLSIRAFWMHRNLRGGAERLRFDAEIEGIGGDTGGTDYRLTARYQRPATFDEDTDFYLEAEIEQLDEVSFFSRQATIEGGIERFVSDEFIYQLGVGLRRGNTRDAFGANQYTLLLFPTSVTLDYRDDEFDARKGNYLLAEASPFIAIDGADNGLLTELDFRTYRSFGENSPLTLALRGQLGSVIGPGLSVAPSDFLFYSGGGGTVRGHGYQTLGVTLPSGERVGGRSFLGLSAEMRFRTTGSLGFVGFFDAGYIGEESIPDGSGEWQSGAGLGVRYATPIGPIRVDLAVPTSGEDDGTSFAVYIGIGQAF
ncbi:MAG: autotransporter assembly complex family protein [Roseobacter sp.]